MASRYKLGPWHMYCGACRAYEYDCIQVRGCIRRRAQYVHYNMRIRARATKESS